MNKPLPTVLEEIVNLEPETPTTVLEEIVQETERRAPALVPDPVPDLGSVLSQLPTEQRHFRSACRSPNRVSMSEARRRYEDLGLTRDTGMDFDTFRRRGY